ncbi:hypothetical protein JCM3774_004213 [Rhodotorula dairenensis]
MTHKPDYIQRPVLAQIPAAAHGQHGAQTQAATPAQTTTTTTAAATCTASTTAQQAQYAHTHPAAALNAPSVAPASAVHPAAYTPALLPLPQRPTSQTYGVSFTGTAKFAPLPFPPCEHRLPPPTTTSTASTPPVPLLATLPLQPPPPYTEAHAGPTPPLGSFGGVVGSAPGPSPSAAAAAGRVAQLQPHHPHYHQEQLTLPLVPPLPSAPATAATTTISTAPNVVLVSAPPPPHAAGPIPVFLSTPSGMVPYGPHAPVLTPWPPIPLRHIDSYLAGHWPPHPSATPQPVVHPLSMPPASTVAQLPMSPRSVATGQQPQQHFETDVITFPVQLGASAHPPLPAVPLAFSQFVTPAVPTPPTTGDQAAAAATTTTTAAAGTQCQVHGCQAHPFCELSPCRCRICRDHLGWVMRGARLIDVETGEEVEPDQQQQVERKRPETRTRKVYRCIACGRQSTKETAASGAFCSGGGGGAGTPPIKKTVASLPGETVSDESTRTATSSTSTGPANAFSIHYFSHGPVSHPQPQPRSLPQESPTVPPVTWPITGSGGALAMAVSPDAHVNPVVGLSGVPVAISTALDPMTGDASFGPYHQMLPAMQQSYAVEGGQAPVVEPSASFRRDLPASPVPYYPISTRKETIDIAPAQPAAVSCGEMMAASDHSLAEAATSLPPRCSSAMASPISPETPEQGRTVSPAQRRPASSPSALETASPQAQLPSPPVACRTPSTIATTTIPLYPSQVYGGYGAMPSPPISRDDPFPFGYEVPYFSDTRTTPYSTFPSPEYGYSPSAQSDHYQQPQQPQQPGLPTPGLGLLGMSPPPPFPGYGTPPRMGGHKKRQSSAVAAKSAKFASPSSSKRQYSPDQPAGLASPVQQSPARAFQPAPLPPEVDGSSLEPREWPIIKIENIPFNTTVAQLEAWLPRGVLAPVSQVVLPIHLILHRASGRTLPHCYVECVSQARANELIATLDRAKLGERTIRVKWERAGELLRDLFDQSVYFAHPSPSPAAAPLPHLPPEGFRLPEKLLTHADLSRLLDYCTTALSFRERPFERAFYNLASIITKFPWQRKDLWDDEIREEVYKCAYESMRHGLMNARRPPGDAIGYRRMAAIINIAVQRCPVFSRSQKEQARLLFGSGALSLTTSMPAPHVPAVAANYEFPPLQQPRETLPQHVGSPQYGQYTPLPASLQTPPRPTSRMRLPDSPETPTPIHRRAEGLEAVSRRSAVTGTATVGRSNVSAVSATPPRFGTTITAKTGSKVALGVAGGQIGVTSRPLSQHAKGVSELTKQPQATLWPTKLPDRQPGKTTFPQQRSATTTVSARPKPTPQMQSGSTTCAFGWMATPPESPTEARPRPKLFAPAAAARSTTAPEQNEDTAEKGWAQE